MRFDSSLVYINHVVIRAEFLTIYREFQIPSNSITFMIPVFIIILTNIILCKSKHMSLSFLRNDSNC